MKRESRSAERTPEEGDYTVLCLKPDFLQCCNNANGFLVMYCTFAIVAGSMIGGITNTNVAALERRFGLDSSESAYIIVSYDIAFSIATVFVSYFGARSHIPRLVSVGAVFFGLGAFIYALPHFISPQYDAAFEEVTGGCSLNATLCSDIPRDIRYNMYILLLGQLLMGLGTTPLYTIGIAYVERSVAKDKAPVYIGIANACALFGPVIGFTCGGAFLSTFYVDFDSVDSHGLGFGSNDPRWVGAWWIGPLAMMALCWSTVIPFWGFPKQLPGTAKHRSERVSEEHFAGDPASAQKLGLDNTLENLPANIGTLLHNPPYLLIVLGGCVSGGTVSGATSFLAKFIENEFHQSAGNAAILAGAVLVPAAATGHLTGGLLISKFKWKTSQIMLYAAVCSFLTTALCPSMILNCKNILVAGVTVDYHIDSQKSFISARNLTFTCNEKCNCEEEIYAPSCGTDNVTYFSPCHAGCVAEEHKTDGPAAFGNCSCVEATLGTLPNVKTSVISGFCNQQCSKIYIFLPLVFCVAFFVFQTHTASAVLGFRIVPESLRAFAVGFAWLFFRGLGTIPGPIMFGKFIDSTCLLWQKRRCTGARGSCWIYDSENMALTFMLLCLIGNFLTVVIYLVMWLVYKPPPDGGTELSSGETSKKNQQAGPHDNLAFSKNEDNEE